VIGVPLVTEAISPTGLKAIGVLVATSAHMIDIASANTRQVMSHVDEEDIGRPDVILLALVNRDAAKSLASDTNDRRDFTY
jgi:hypothetical protein